MLLSVIISVIISLSPQTDKKEQAKILAHKGFSQIEAKEYKKAVKSFENAIKLDKNCKEAHLGKGVAYYRWGNYNRREIYPEEFIKKALKIDPFYIVAKIHIGWCYYYKGSKNRAAEYFRELLKKNIGEGKLYYHAAKFFSMLNNLFYEDKKEIPNLLNKAVECGYEKPELYYMLGWNYFLKDSINYALEIYNKGQKLEDGKRSFQTDMDLALIHYNSGNTEKADSLFRRSYSIMTEKIREFFKNDNLLSKENVLTALAVKYYLDDDNKLTTAGKEFLENGHIFYEKGAFKENAFMSIMTDAEKEEYLELTTISERKKYRARYLMKINTNPFTEENEVESEFNKRLDYVLNSFKANNEVGFDDRGIIYLKYGEPDNKFIAPAMVEYPKNIKYDRRGIESESWYYIRLDFYLAFDFYSSMGRPFKKIGSLFDLALSMGTSRGSTLNSLVRELFTERRFVLGGIYSMMAETPGDIMIECLEFAIRRDEMDEKTTRYYPPKTDTKHLNFGFKTADFKGKTVKSNNEIYYGIKLDKLKFLKHGNIYHSSIKFYASIIDSNTNKLFIDSVESTFYSETNKKEGIAINQVNYNLNPGKYTLFLQLKNPESNSRGIYSQEITIENYKTKELILSDIQFSFNIKEAKSGDKHVKNGLKITPYPFFEVSRSNPLFVYYEIYNLSLNSKSQTRYEISYNLKLLERKESIFRRLFSGKGYKESISFSKKDEGTEKNTFDYTSFDLSKLRLGKYELTIKVKDRLTGNETEKSDTFILVK